jgi:hypothetical protein
MPSTPIGASFNLRERKSGHGMSRYDDSCFKYLDGFVKLDGKFMDDLDLIEFYEFNSIGKSSNYKKIPSGDYMFVLGYGKTKDHIRFGLVKLNPGEYFSYHYSLMTLMLMKDPSLSMILAGEFQKKDDATAVYSDMSGTFYNNNFKELLKYMNHDENGVNNVNNVNNVKPEILLKYTDWVNRHITPLIAKLTYQRNRAIEFVQGKILITDNSVNVRNSFIKRCRANDKKKKVYLSKNDCSKGKNSIGNVCDPPLTLMIEMTKHKDGMRAKFNTLDKELQTIIHTNINDLSVEQLFIIYRAMGLPIAPITFQTRGIFIKRLQNVLRENTIIA